MEYAALSQLGLLPVLIGFLGRSLPLQPGMVGGLFALLDALGCAMVVLTARRLGAPPWASVVGGIVQATYIPSVIGCGAILQQPLLRFALVAVVWAYTLAFTSDRRPSLWIGVCTAASVVAGFTTVMTRPLVWIIPAVVALSCCRTARFRRLARVQAGAMLAVILCLGLVAVGVRMPKRTLGDRVRFVFIGLPAKGEVSYTVSILSFSNWWLPDERSAIRPALNLSPVNAATAQPLIFLRTLGRSVFENWLYPDYLYFHEFLLDRRGQAVQHRLLVLCGLAGLGWLVGQRGPRRQIALIAITTIAYSSLASGSVSVEPRRLSTLMPLLALGAGVFAAATGFVARLLVSPLFLVCGSFLLLDAALPWPQVVALAPRSPDLAHSVWVVCASGAAAVVAAKLLAAWRRALPGLSIRLPGALLSVAVAFVGLGRLTEEEWRAFSLRTEATVVQRIEGLDLSGPGWPWLLIDLESVQEAERLALRVGGRLVKSCGAAVWTWRPGAPQTWSAYAELARHGRDGTVPITWHAQPLPPDLVLTSQTEVEVQPCQGAVGLRGDFLRTDGRYPGPLFEPWHTSLFRWIWNGEDPRYPVPRVLPARHTTSLKGAASGLFQGPSLLRVFVARLPFGPRSNLASPPALEEERTQNCPRGRPVAHLPSADLQVCRSSQGNFLFFGPGPRFVGSTRASAFSDRDPLEPGVVARLRGSTAVEIVQLQGELAIAHFRRPNGETLGSVAFAVRQP